MTGAIRVREARRLLEEGSADAARDMLGELVARRPANPAVLHLAAYAAHLSGASGEAVRLQGRLVALAPDHPSAMFNLALYLSEAGRHLEALGLILPLARRKDAATATLRLAGRLLMRADLLAEAHQLFARALRLDPGFHNCAFDMAKCLARMGRFSDALRFYESRRKLFTIRPRTHLTPWDGQGVPARLHVFAEQGLGDFLMFMRYLRHPALAETRLTVAVDERLHRLVGPALPGVTLMRRDHPGPEDGIHCTPVMSLPFLLGLSGDELACSAPYLAAEPGLTARWRERLGDDGRLRAGIVWQGNPGHPGDARRSLKAESLAGIAGIDAVRLIALQKGDGAGEGAGAGIETIAAPFDDGEDAFVDTAAIMAGLDVVISVDTATAHLAGALGVPCLMLLSRHPDWRWGAGTTTTLWYPSLTLYRQVTEGDWEAPVAALASGLRRLARKGASGA